MAQNPYAAPPMGMPMQNPEVRSLQSLLGVVRIIALIIGVLLFIAFLGLLAFAVFAGSAGVPGYAVGYGFGFALIPLGLFFVVDLIAYMQIGEIRRMVDAGRYQEAKDKTLIWMIIGFIFGGIVIGLLMLFAFIKFDDVINWQRQSQMGGPPAGWIPPPMAVTSGAPVAQPVTPTAASPATAPPSVTCPRCGRPATWIAQYNRWYCYTDQSYV